VTPHFYATTTCLYCGAPEPGPCPTRDALERDWSRRAQQPYDPIAHLRTEAGRCGARVESADTTEPGAVRSVFRVVREGVVIAEGSAVVSETAARVALVALMAKGPANP
jgi:hypothetical protein